MQNEKFITSNEKIDVESYAKRILAVLKEEFPDIYAVTVNNLSDQNDWWDNFRYLRRIAIRTNPTSTHSEATSSIALHKIITEINEYAAKSPNDTTFN